LSLSPPPHSRAASWPLKHGLNYKTELFKSNSCIEAAEDLKKDFEKITMRKLKIITAKN
jgi:hypothetical protein